MQFVIIVDKDLSLFAGPGYYRPDRARIITQKVPDRDFGRLAKGLWSQTVLYCTARFVFFEWIFRSLKQFNGDTSSWKPTLFISEYRKPFSIACKAWTFIKNASATSTNSTQGDVGCQSCDPCWRADNGQSAGWDKGAENGSGAATDTTRVSAAHAWEGFEKSTPSSLIQGAHGSTHPLNYFPCRRFEFLSVFQSLKKHQLTNVTSVV